jgi:hypothetical protein
MDINYRYNSKNELIIRDICDYILTKEFGTTITYTEISRRIGLNIELEEGMKLFKRLMNKARNVLIDYSYALKIVNGTGYYILKPNQISSYTYRTFITKPQRAYEKAKRILERTNKSKFEQIDHEEHQDVTELNNQLIEVSDYTILNSNYYANKNKYINKE